MILFSVHSVNSFTNCCPMWPKSLMKQFHVVEQAFFHLQADSLATFVQQRTFIQCTPQTLPSAFFNLYAKLVFGSLFWNICGHLHWQGIFVPWTCCLSNDDLTYPQLKNSNQCQIDAMLYPNNKDVHEVTALKTEVSATWFSFWSEPEWF